MNILYLWFSFVSLFAVVFGFAAAFSNASRIRRWALVIAAVALIPLTYVAALDMLSRAKPVSKEMFLYDTKVAEVKGWHAIAGRKLWITLFNRDWGDDPVRLHSYPWNKETKEMVAQLRQAWAQAQHKKKPLFMHDPFEPSLSKEKPIFQHPDPPPRLPPKDLFQNPNEDKPLKLEI